MSRLLMSGWETGDIAQIGAISTSTIAPTVASSTPTARSGTYCLKCLINNSGSTNYCGIACTHASQTEMYYAFGLYRSNASEQSNFPNQFCFSVLDTAGNMNVGLSCENDGSIRAYYASGGGSRPTVSAGNFTLIGASTVTVPLTTWALIELHLIAATGATGRCEIRVNGQAALSVTSVRTAQSNANFGGLRLEFFRPFGNNGSAASFFAYDDLRVNTTAGSANNSWLGDAAIRALFPNGAGATIGGTALTGVPGSPNWQNVDEVPPSTIDYNSGATVGTGELYALTDTTGTIVLVPAVNIIAYALNSDSGGGSVGLTLNSGGSNSEGSAQALAPTAAYYNRLLETDPSDSTAWTQTKLNVLQVGITVR